MELEQVYHPFNVWEDHEHGFYNNISGGNKVEMIEQVVEMFSDPVKTTIHMERVIDHWPYSCEHNFTNPAMNRVAYLGQAACAIYKNIPSTVTMEAWSSVPKEFQDIADGIAEKTIKKWELNYKKNA